MSTVSQLNAERLRLENQHAGKEDWRLWGPYLSERAWGTVREDYSPHGTAWEHFSHDQARSRAYRWSEDGMGGICDVGQRLCLAFAFWNGRDPLLKERAFGLTGNEGNHGEDVKEYYFYVDATPTHSYLCYRYFYPQAEFPYGRLVEENRTRGRGAPPFGLLDTGAFDDGRYFDVQVHYAKAAPGEIHAHVFAYNRGQDAAELHLLPQLWFRNEWSWEDGATRPEMRQIPPPAGAAWAIEASHPTLGVYYLYGAQPTTLLFTENDSNAARLWNTPNAQPYVKDAFHRHVIDGAAAAVNPAQCGTKAAAWYRQNLPAAGGRMRIDLVLSAQPLEAPFARTESLFARRKSEADVFYDDLLPEATPGDHLIFRQALAGMIWSKQFFHYDVERWLRGDRLAAQEERHHGRNHHWKHFKAHHVISMPDAWEYPWFAAWDLAYHCAALALVDVDFAKDQLELLLHEDYLHPNGQIPAYEWAFGDVNPPVHAMAVLKCFRAERVQRGRGDIAFLQRVFHKLLMNYTWWINRKDADGNSVFEGGFLGLDNISVFDRSQPLPLGYALKQADATGWMAMFALQMTLIALEICTEDAVYEDVAIQCYRQFLSIANAIAGHADGCLPLWDEQDGFFKDLLIAPGGACHHIDVYSWVGLIPLFATEVVDRRLLQAAPRFARMLHAHKGGKFQGSYICACPDWENERGEHLLSIVNHNMLPRILQRLLDEDQFLSPHGIRGVSKWHAAHTDLGVLPGIGQAMIEYVPGESTSGLFGGNSNWRGPVWMPCNYSLIQALEKFHRFLGDAYQVPVPALGGRALTLKEIADLIAERLAGLYRRDAAGRVAAMPAHGLFRDDPNWQNLFLFFEYFHGDTGQGLGAAHQTGWTGLIANLVQRHYREAVPRYWRGESPRAAGGAA